MADEDEVDEELDEDGEDEDEEGGSSDGGGKKKLFIIIGLALLLVIGGAAAAYFTGLLQPLIEMIAGDGAAEDEEAIAQDAIFYDLPELLVNLSTTGRKSTFLKIRIALELEKPEDVPVVERVMPRIIDNFQVYLRELRVEDLKGSAGMYRLREELLKRVGAAIAPAKINDVLFKEMLVQ
ncbi:MAG: flagellar basal body-associated FliL family protein [Rhodospirillaceae bacterium]|nr:flagellar basal body-associated FliL family protein [Rhodospirillaceae bacterium]MBL6942595.1 flagellar basal body-associated FliL family protein [Rhodospirillales bacterium]